MLGYELVVGGPLPDVPTIISVNVEIRAGGGIFFVGRAPTSPERVSLEILDLVPPMGDVVLETGID